MLQQIAERILVAHMVSRRYHFPMQLQGHLLDSQQFLESERNFHAESWDTSILHVFTSPYVEVTRRWVCKPFSYCFKVLVPSTHKVLSNCTQQKGPDPTSWTFLTCVVHFLRSHENLEHPK